MLRLVTKTLRGKASPFQLLAACVIGASIGFVPGVSIAPGLLLAWLAVLLVLNANLSIAAAVTLGAKIVSFALLPVSVSVGRLLIDGPTQPLFKAAVNAPVLAWFGLDHYAVAGGQLIGITLGVATGLIVVNSVTNFRKKMASVEENSEMFAKLSTKRSVRILSWMLIGSGGKGKKTYTELLESKGNPVRVLGVVAVALAAGFLFLLTLFASDSLVTPAVRAMLERANGATVDLENASLDLSAQTLTLTGIAAADPNALDTNLFEAQSIVANLSGASILSKRFAFDRIEVADSVSGSARAVPGIRYRPPARPGPRPEAEGDDTGSGETPGAAGIPLEDYLAEAEKWRERLQQARRWLETIGGGDSSEESVEESIERQKRDMGLARIRAEHLVDGSPTVLVRELLLSGTDQRTGGPFVLRGSNIATQPALVAEPAKLEVTLGEGDRSVTIDLDPGAANGRLALQAQGMELDRVLAGLASQQPLSGGTVDFSATGPIDLASGAAVDLAASALLKNTSVQVPGQSPQNIEQLTIPMGIRGPLDRLGVSIQGDAIQQALIAAGKERLAGELNEALGGALDGALDGVVPEEAGGLLEGLAEGITGGEGHGDEGDGQSVEENLKDAAGDAIGNLFGGNKDDDE